MNTSSILAALRKAVTPQPSSPRSLKILAGVVLVGTAFVLLFFELTKGSSANALCQQGSQLAKILLAQEIQATLPKDKIIYMVEPPPGKDRRFTNSTEYFRYLLRENVIEGQDFALFGGAGARPVRTMDPARFRPENNAWNVVVLDEVPEPIPEGTPLLISRNLVLPGDRLPVGEDVNVQALIEHTTDRRLEFSRTLVVVVTIDGERRIFLAKNLGPGKAHLLNPTGKPLRVLRP